MSELNIYQRMNKITEEVGFVNKNLKVAMGGGSYKAVAEVDVIEAVKPLEMKYGIYSYPLQREVIESKETETKGGTVNQFMRLLVVYRFVNTDKPSEYIDITSFGDGVDSGDKAPGKAMTYADKYALLKAYKISTGDDPDKDASEEQKTKTIALASENQISTIIALLKDDANKIMKTAELYSVKSLKDLTVSQASEIIQKIKAKQEVKISDVK